MDVDLEFVEVGEEEEIEGSSFEDGFESELIDDKEELDEIVSLLQQEYDEAEAEIMQRAQKWEKYRRQLKGEPDHDVKNYPFPNSSNVRVPLTRNNTYTIYSMLKNSLFGRKPFWTVSANKDAKEERSEAKVLQKYMNMIAESPVDMDMKRKSDTALLDCSLLGFNWVEIPWYVLERNIVSVNEESGLEEAVPVVVHAGPDFIPVQPEDILYKHVWDRVEDIPFFFVDRHLPEHVLKERSEQGIYKNVDFLLDFYREDASEEEVEKARLNDIELGREKIFDVTQCYFYYDVNNDGIEEYVVFTVNMDSGIVLKQEYNYLGRLPLVSVNLIKESFQIEGGGVGAANEHMQDEADAIHNLRNDNMKVANMKIIAARKTGTIHEREQWYPGKILFTDNPKEDIFPFGMGDVYPSSLQAENMTVMYGQKAAGVSDVMGGFADQTMRTADSGIASSIRLNQGKGLFGSIMENTVDSFTEIGLLVYYQLVLHKKQVIEFEQRRERLSEEELGLLSRALNVKRSDVSLKFRFKFQTSDVEQTFEVQRQSMLTLTQLYAQWAQQTFPLAQQLFGPNGQQMLQQAPELYQHMMSVYVGSTKLLANMFNFFGREDEEEFLPDTKRSEMLLDMVKQMQDMLGGQAALAGQPQVSPEQRAMMQQQQQQGMSPMSMQQQQGNGGMM